MAEKVWKFTWRFMIVMSVLAAIKMLFFDYTMDEEYQIVMAYRNVMGDHLFTQMWEPHQTSAFLCAFLIKLFITITGTNTGLILFIRICTTGIQLLVSWLLYRTLRKITPKEFAALAGMIFFNLVPKNIQIPEFGNMQVWFFTLIVICLMEYFISDKRNPAYMVMAGLFMALEVLAYPSCIILFPFFCIVLGVYSGKKRIRDIAVFTGTCAVCAAGYLLLILRNISLEEFLRNAANVIGFDVTHDFDAGQNTKYMRILENIQNGFIMILGICAAAAVIWALYLLWQRKRNEVIGRAEKVLSFCIAAVMVSCLVQMYYWVVKRAGFEFPHIHLVVLMLAGAAAWPYASREKRKWLGAGILGSLVSLGAVLYFSDLVLYNALPHGLIGPLFCTLAVVAALLEKSEVRGRYLGLLLMSVWCLTSIFGKGFTLRDGRNYNTVLQTEAMMQYGPAIGIMADYMTVCIYNRDYEDWNQYVKPGDKVLVVANTIMANNTTAYMFEDVEVSHYSIVNPTAYDERLVHYWELYPEKKPNVIVVDCWFGELLEDPDNFIMQYIENEFGYTSMNDGSYQRFYRSE